MVLTGRDKGKQGTVLRVIEDSRVLVESVNMIKRHTKPNPNKGVTGGIIDREAPIHISNVALYNPATGKGERVGMRTMQDKSKVRYFKKSGEVADVK
uniref:Large ribosomal subunit protein uL24 n=1 Tax=uncultured proteobacterium Rifle_16ft_4_minimus_30456 TaxID=1665207 RepID=A0A0H4T2Q0_9PROT|nr:50S ribosomal protein L24, large subunit ribosomal protein L24 [uncultured proteobacterium Rifle_16ft_4_minimus_30456]